MLTRIERNHHGPGLAWGKTGKPRQFYHYWADIFIRDLLHPKDKCT